MLAKTKSNNIKLIISKTLSVSYISHDEFVLVNVSKKYDIKEEIKNQKNVKTSVN